MKLNRMMAPLLLTIMLFSIAACSVFSVSNRGAQVTIETKPKQPNVIVNENVNERVKAGDKT